MTRLEPERSILARLARAGALALCVATLQSCDSDPALARIDDFIAARTDTIDKSKSDWRTDLPMGPVPEFSADRRYLWVLETNLGPLRLELLPEAARVHVANTIYLTRLGFYDGLVFHRVIQGFMAQGGCPLGNGQGDAGYKLPLEVKPGFLHDRRGTLAAARSRDPNSAGTQFYITFAPRPQLDGQYTVYGRMVDGEATLAAIEARGAPEDPGTPSEAIRIESARIEVE